MKDSVTNYTQHVRITTDLELTTRNLPDTVSSKFRGSFVYMHYAVVCVHRFLGLGMDVVLEMYNLRQLGIMSDHLPVISLQGYLHSQ